MDRNVPSNCLGQTSETRCLKWSGPNYPTLNIKTGDSIHYVLDRIISFLDQTESDTSDTVNVSCLDASNSSDCGAMISNRILHITKSSSTGGVSISWDASGISNSLPEGYSISGAQVIIRSKDGAVQFSGSQSTAQTSVQLARFPVYIDYTLFIFTPCGAVRLVNTIPVDANPGSTTHSLSLIDVPGAASEVSTLKDAVELLAREVCSIKNQLS